MEVSNNSPSDPCAWLGCVASVGKKYLVRQALLSTQSLLSTQWSTAYVPLPNYTIMKIQ